MLYHFLQKDLLRKDIWLFQMFTARLVASLGVWMAPEIYSRYPLLRPYAVRDPLARGSRSMEIADQWGSPNEEGLFRDDNSLIKGMPRALDIHAPDNAQYNGKRIEKGFVASHIWRELSSGGLTVRHRLTYSFVPNLVWLPVEVSKLTDREGSFVQAYLQALSMHIYRGVQVHPELRDKVEESWSLLPEPVGIPEEGLPARDDLAYFSPKESFYRRNLVDLGRVVAALTAASENRALPGRVVATRYGDGLTRVAQRTLIGLRDELSRYLEALETAADGPESGS